MIPMPEVKSVKVMWDLDDKEYGIVVPVYDSEEDSWAFNEYGNIEELPRLESDATLIERAWALVTSRISRDIRPRNKSDLRVVRSKKKK